MIVIDVRGSSTNWRSMTSNTGKCTSLSMLDRNTQTGPCIRTLEDLASASKTRTTAFANATVHLCLYSCARRMNIHKPISDELQSLNPKFFYLVLHKHEQSTSCSRRSARLCRLRRTHANLLQCIGDRMHPRVFVVCHPVRVSV